MIAAGIAVVVLLAVMIVVAVVEIIITEIMGTMEMADYLVDSVALVMDLDVDYGKQYYFG